MFNKLTSIFMGLMWRLGNSLVLRPPSSRERAAEEVQDLQRERMRIVLSMMDHKAALDSVTRKLEVMQAIMENDVNDDIFETLAGLELATDVQLHPNKTKSVPATFAPPDALAGNISRLHNNAYTTIHRQK